MHIPKCVILIANGESNFGVVTIIQVMCQVEKVLIGGISHHIRLINTDQQILRVNRDWVGKLNSLHDLVSPAP